MEVVQADSASLSNCEVLSLMNELKDTVKNYGSSANHFGTLVYETAQFLQSQVEDQTEEDVTRILLALNKFHVPFTKDEKLMMVNTPPKTTLEISLLIRNYDERLTESEITTLIDLITPSE